MENKEIKKEQENKKAVVEKSTINAEELNSLLQSIADKEEEQEEQIDYREVSIKMNANSASMQDNGVQLVSRFKNAEGIKEKCSVRLHRADLTEKDIMSDILNKDIELVNPTRTVITSDANGNKLPEPRVFYTAEDYKVIDSKKKTKEDSFFDMNLSIVLEEAELEVELVETNKRKNGKLVKEPIYRIIGEKQEGMSIIDFAYELKLEPKELKILEQSLSGKVFNCRVNYIEKLKGKPAFTTAKPTFL